MNENRICQNCRASFIIEPEDFNFYKKIDVPPPTFCPECRLQRRLAFRNERSLYRRQCDLCKEQIISMYSPDKPFKVYCPSCYYSDKWDSLEYGQEYDFNKTFFEQWWELRLRVPNLSLFQENSVNSPWVNYELDDKNCYLNVGGHYNEDSAYSQYLLKCRDVFDSYSIGGGEFVYEAILGERQRKVFYSILCFDCQDTYFSFDCRDCANVFGCSGLRHKQYHIYNQPVSKEEFKKFMDENWLGSASKLLELKDCASDFWKTQPQRAVFTDKCVNSSGNILEECKNCQFAWNVGKGEDSKYLMHCREVKDAYDTTSVWWVNLAYEFIAAAEQLYNIRFSVSVIKGCSDVEYSNMLINSHDCFGSTCLRNKSYCILNKQYSEREYKLLREKIIRHMNDVPYVTHGANGKSLTYRYGEFFPYDVSPFGYNETTANEYFPIDKSVAEERGYKWSDYDAGQSVSVSDYEISDNIKDVKDDILEKVLKCEISSRPYRLIPMELAFYRRFNLPIPRRSPFERHKRRLSFLANHLRLIPRECFGCHRTVDSVYLESEFPKIYCEECYLKNL